MTPFSSLFFKDTATTELYTLSLHDALPIFGIAVVESIQIIFHSLGADSAGDLLIVPDDRCGQGGAQRVMPRPCLGPPGLPRHGGTVPFQREIRPIRNAGVERDDGVRDLERSEE